MEEFSTPLMRQYSAIKQRHPNALLFFRLGDFYELFFEDAVVAAKELQITLTSRNKEKGTAIPMCGVPYHAAEGYIAKLIRKGFRVAICDQVEDPREAKKLVKREVTRVVTPGTAIDSQVLEPRENNYLASVVRRNGAAGLALVDLSTGDFRATEFCGDGSLARLRDELDRMRPSELLLASGTPSPLEARNGGAIMTQTPLDEWVFGDEYGARLLRDHFHVATLAGYGLEGHPFAVAAAGAILHYVRETQRGSLAHLDGIRFYQQQDSLLLDPSTLRNLELVDPAFGESRASTLLGVLDQCTTSLGARKLKAWMMRPSLDREELNARLDAVEEWTKNTIAREELRRVLGSIQDLERLLSKVTLETANARELLALKQSLHPLPILRTYLSRFRAHRIGALHTSLDELADVHELLEKSIHPEPPVVLSEGGMIRPGYHAELDELRNLGQNSKRLLAQIEQRERERTGVASLKVRFNNVFGYYIEISKANMHLAPPDYERKQTLVNAERFTTPELKELEVKILDAEERSHTLERDLFVGIRRQVGSQAARIRQTAAVLAELDVLTCFAHIAAERDYHRPEFSDDGELLIQEGRHPVIERIVEEGQTGKFIPNDLYMNGGADLLLIVTGPNMGGKSTYLRQAAQIALMAQMGSFVPASRAQLPIFDRIFTRIGASDNLARGRSTFMVEMTEAAAILNTATPRSLVLLDEVGRGTATFDGLSIAWAVVEFLAQKLKARTLFATHYHELTRLSTTFANVKNFNIAVREWNDQILFLRKIVEGGTDKSYGIQVARLAGVPKQVVERAKKILASLETGNGLLAKKDRTSPEPEPQVPSEESLAQLSFFGKGGTHPVLEELKELDLNELTPLEALNLLGEWKKKIQE